MLKLCVKYSSDLDRYLLAREFLQLESKIMHLQCDCYICDRICEKGSYTRIPFFKFKEV